MIDAIGNWFFGDDCGLNLWYTYLIGVVLALIITFRYFFSKEANDEKGVTVYTIFTWLVAGSISWGIVIYAGSLKAITVLGNLGEKLDKWSDTTIIPSDKLKEIGEDNFN